MILAHPRPQLAVCTPVPRVRLPGGGTRTAPLTYEWHAARLRLRMPFGFDCAEVGIVGLEVGAARNLAVTTARESGCRWLFFLDYDVLPAPTCLKQLMYRATATHPGYDVYSGIYCTKERPSVPLLYRGWNTGPYWDWDFGDVLTEGVVNSGMGCALLDLNLFDRLAHTDDDPWFKTHELDGGGTVTEDCWFTKRLTEEAGGTILVDCDRTCLCGHIDNTTGETFILGPDAPPVVRAGLAPP